MSLLLAWVLTMPAGALPQDRPELAVAALEVVAPGEVRLPDRNLVSRLRVPGDLDGDGADDLWLSRYVMRKCNFERAVGGIDLLSGMRGPIGSVDAVHGSTAVDVWRGAAGREGRMLRANFETWGGTSSVELRSLDGRWIHWALESSPIPLDDNDGTVCLLPGLSDATVPDVILGAAHAQRVDDGPRFGAVAKLSGADGSTHWVHWAQIEAHVWGRHVEPAGDLDGDGANDVVVCVPEIVPAHPDPARRAPHLEFLSGADGSAIGWRTLEPARVQRFRGVGDVDGDRLADFVVQTSEPARGEGPPTWLVLSAFHEPVRVLPEHEVLWFTPWTASGRAQVLVGVRERSSNSKSLQLVTPEGARRFADYPASLSRKVDHVAEGDFDGDGLLDLAVVERVPRPGVGHAQRLVVVPGLSMR